MVTRSSYPLKPVEVKAGTPVRSVSEHNMIQQDPTLQLERLALDRDVDCDHVLIINTCSSYASYLRISILPTKFGLKKGVVEW
jgi:hypothetical protein